MAPPAGGRPPRRKPTDAGAAAGRARPAARKPGPARLVATSGPAAGEEFALEGDEAVIGRASENAVALPDSSVSRRHVLLRQTELGWAASDLGSGNGTLVNGETIAAETPLAHGDVITLGESELRFEAGAAAPRSAARRAASDPMAQVSTSGYTRAVVRTSRRGAVEAAEAASRKKKVLGRVGAALVLLLGGGVAWQVRQKQASDLKRRQQVVEAQRVSELKTLKQEGNNLLRAGKFIEAKEKFVQLEARDPDFDKVSVAGLMAAVERETPNQQRLVEAEQALTRGEIAVAARALAQVTQETTQYKERDRLRELMRKKVAEKLDAARPLTGNLRDRPAMVQLKALAEDVLVAEPESRGALALKELADAAIERLDHPPKVRQRPKTPWLEVQDTFALGDLSGAAALADACGGKFPPCRAIKGQLVDFGERMKKAENLSPEQVLGLVELDKKIGGGKQSPLTRVVARKAADDLYRKASSAKATGNWTPAIENAQKALRLDPGHNAAKALVADARSVAKDIFFRAYQMKDNSPDDAIKLFKEVIAMTPRDDEYHLKAKQRLEELAK